LTISPLETKEIVFKTYIIVSSQLYLPGGKAEACALQTILVRY